ncbi:MAG TPA: hypothetical protein VIJ82_18540 [Streptosporangiaceae bacterium]
MSLAVGDLDQAVADIGGRGITAGPVEVIGEAGRKAAVTDADGNTLAFIQVTPSSPPPPSSSQ